MVQDHLVTFYAIYSAKYRQFHGIVDLKVIVTWESPRVCDLENVFGIKNIYFWAYLYCNLENPNFWPWYPHRPWENSYCPRFILGTRVTLVICNPSQIFKQIWFIVLKVFQAVEKISIVPETTISHHNIRSLIDCGGTLPSEYHVIFISAITLLWCMFDRR